MRSDDPLQELGRGVSQLHLKLSRIQERLDALRPPAPAPAGELDALLDLVDAVEGALERRPASRRGWFRRSPSADDLWRGLAIAAAQVRERLRSSGIEPAPVEGAFDPRLHHVVEVVPVQADRAAGALAATHRRGWLRRRGAEVDVLRTAQVSVHGADS